MNTNDNSQQDGGNSCPPKEENKEANILINDDQEIMLRMISNSMKAEAPEQPQVVRLRQVYQQVEQLLKGLPPNEIWKMYLDGLKNLLDNPAPALLLSRFKEGLLRLSETISEAEPNIAQTVKQLSETIQ